MICTIPQRKCRDGELEVRNGWLLGWADAMGVPDYIAFGILFVLMIGAVTAYFHHR
jgi:hypothetical protein